MSSFLENIRLNDDLKEKLNSASDKVLNYVNERPLWERFQIVTDKNDIGDNTPNSSKYCHGSSNDPSSTRTYRTYRNLIRSN